MLNACPSHSFLGMFLLDLLFFLVALLRDPAENQQTKILEQVECECDKTPGGGEGAGFSVTRIMLECD